MDSKTTVHLSISGATSAEVLAAAASFGGSTGTALNTEELLAELRDRFAKADPPQVVRVEPFASDSASGDAGKATTTRTRQPKADKEPPKPTNKETQAAAPDASSEQASGDDWGSEGEDDAKEVTMDDVKTALNAYSAKHGQVATRDKMKEVGGSLKLIDIPKEKYGPLVEALKVAA